MTHCPQEQGYCQIRKETDRQVENRKQGDKNIRIQTNHNQIKKIDRKLQLNTITIYNEKKTSYDKNYEIRNKSNTKIHILYNSKFSAKSRRLSQKRTSLHP